MIVQCPSCTSRYRVNAANIPATGGKIRCPSCSHAFAVYPESAPEPEPYLDAENKTSIAERPNLQELLSQMRQGGGEVSAPVDDAKTEVMDGGSLPDFAALFGGNAPESDSTVEMANPLLHLQSGGGGPSAPAFQDDLATQELSADIVAASLGHVREQVQERAPIQGTPEMQGAGQAPPHPVVGQPPMPSQQRRVSAPSGPTPPPSKPPSSRPPGPPPMPSLPRPGATRGGPESGAPVPGPSQSSPMHFGATPATGEEDQGGLAAHEGPWKLQTNFGLTYEFADNKSLRNWLDSRDELDGFKLSADGTDFLPLSEFPQLQQARTAANRRISSTGAMAPIPGDGPGGGAGMGLGRTASGAGFASGPMPGIPGEAAPPRSPFTTAQQAVRGPEGAQAQPERERIDPNQTYRPPSRDGGMVNKLLWATFAVLVVAALGVGVYLLDSMGVIDVFEKEAQPPQANHQLLGETVRAPSPGEDESDEADEGALRARQEQQLQRMLDDAREDLDSNRLTYAKERLDNALLLEPERLEIYEMKAEIHEKLGEADLAEEMKAKAEELRQRASENSAAEPPTE